jgi:N-acetylglucosamine kinase-like BadF-type ATPase
VTGADSPATWAGAGAPDRLGAGGGLRAADLLLGADVGGTATRVAVASSTGQVLAVATGPAGNPNSVGLAVSAQRIRTVTAECLGRLVAARPGGDDRVVVRRAVLGLAGGAGADADFLSTALPPGLTDRARLVSDLSVAFSSATPASEGYVLVAGTGAVAGRIVDGDLLERRDGWGWLLGDEGSGFWLGREVVRATLTRLQAGQALGPLHQAVVDAAGTADPVELVQRCYAHPPIWLASFGQLVSQHPTDPTAAEIAARAADLLLGTLLGLGLRPELPVVLAGSVATRPGPVNAALTSRLEAQLGSEVLTAASGVVGALWLAGRDLGITDTAVHARLGSSFAAAVADQ